MERKFNLAPQRHAKEVLLLEWLRIEAENYGCGRGDVLRNDEAALKGLLFTRSRELGCSGCSLV